MFSIYIQTCCSCQSSTTMLTLLQIEPRSILLPAQWDPIDSIIELGKRRWIKWKIVVDTIIQIYRKIRTGKSKCDDRRLELTARCRVDFPSAIHTGFTMFSWESHGTVTWVAIDVICTWCAVFACVINAIDRYLKEKLLLFTLIGW